MKLSTLLVILFFLTVDIYSQTSNDILNLLINNKTISQAQADSIRAENAILQQSSLADKKLKIDFEFRPRTEYRNGYQQLRNDTTVGAFFTNQRSRLSASYSLNNRFNLQFSVQDLRVWGQQDPKSTSATLQVFEAYAEPYLTDKLSIRIGRQRLVYDNQRLFAENDWRLSGATHDAFNIRYYSSRISTELALAFNQTSERLFGTDYTPSGFTNYKFLAVHYLKFNPIKYITVTGLNSTDAYQDKSKTEKLYFRYTLGGRIEFEKNFLYATFSGYYQGGQNSTGKNLSAWYIQPEVKITLQSGTVARIGVEVFSGDNNGVTTSTDHSFVPLYGVAHRFNGNMDLITKFPTDVRSAGLINPYLFLIQPVQKKFELRADFHTFSLQRDFYVSNKKIDRYLGFENDLIVSYKPNAVTKIDVGFAYLIPTESFAIIKTSGNSKYDLSWAFISLTFKPVLFQTNFK